MYRMSPPIRERILSVLYYVLRSLIILTPILLVWHHFGMNKVFEISPTSGHRFSVKDDRPMNGASIAQLSRADKAMVMDCHLEKKYEWPFCDMTIQLAEIPDGVDLSNYDSVTFDLSYSGPGPNIVRFYVRNFEEGLSKPSEWLSLKVNGTEFEVPQGGRITVPVRFFQVASWWLAERKIPLAHSDTRIDRVPYVEVSTASLATSGDHRIEVRSIRFNGKWISQAQLTLTLVVAWLLFGVSRLVMELVEFQAHLHATKLRVAHLVTILRAKRDKAHLDARLSDPEDDFLEEEEGSSFSSADQLSREQMNGSGIDVVEAEAESMNPQQDDTLPPQLPEAEAETSPPKIARASYLRWISATVGNSVRLIAVDDIIYFQTEQKYTRVVLEESQVLIKKSLKDLLNELDPEQFWRIHRSIIVNALEINSIEPNIGGHLAVKLKSRREQLPVSDAFMKRIRQM